MPLVEHLHLEHVLQTVCVLESVVRRSFGPEGGQVLFTQDTGQAMLSRSGTRILTALRLEHPLARMVVECVLKHSTVTGDGSKTFILLMASLLRIIHTTACKEPNLSLTYNSKAAAEAATARHLADNMLAFALEELDDLIAIGVVPYGCCLSWEDFTAKTQLQAHTNNHCVQSLLASFFYSRLGRTHCEFMSNLTCELLTHWKIENDLPSSSLHFVNDNLAALHTAVSGFPISCSRLIKGQVIHRDFAAHCPQTDHQPVKAVVFTGYLQNIVHFSTWAERSLECVIAKLQSLGVSVLLSAVKQTAAVLALALQAEMSIVECVSEDELSLFARLSRATPVRDCWVIEPEHVATLTFCRPILLGAHRYEIMCLFLSHPLCISKVTHMIQLILDYTYLNWALILFIFLSQVCPSLRDAIRMLLSTWEPTKRTLHSNKSTSLHTDNQIATATPSKQYVLEPGCVIAAGGTFEFLLNHALLLHGSSCSFSDDTIMGVPAVSQLLANALLSVPRQIYSHSPRRFLQTQTRLLNEGTLTKHCCPEADPSPKVFMLDSGLESVSCKYQVLLAVLQCVSSLLRVDTVLHTHTVLHTQSHRLPNISWEGTEDEAED
uniref:Bardet-Biedl syndrome 10 n=1 Tax=Cyclopterus lumpus TaxID=8103 RepID=A0A8C2WCY2_CYCLU